MTGAVARARAVHGALPAWLAQVVEVGGSVLVVGLLVTAFADANSLYTWTTCAIYAIFALGTNVLFGWSGSASFGQAAYFGAGAYTAGLLRAEIWSPLAVVPLAAVVAFLVAAAFGLLTLTVSGLRFAILTLVAAQFLYLLVYRSEWFGTETGLYPVFRGSVFGQPVEDQQYFFWVTLAVLAVVAFVLLRMYRSSYGLALRAIRDDTVRAASLGLPVRRLNLLAFAVAGGVAGAAGALFAAQQGSASPSMLSFTLSGAVVLMCLLGGRHSFWGPAVGAAVYTWAQRILVEQTSAPNLWLGLVLLLIVLAMPEGLAQIRGLLRWRPGRPRRPGDRAAVGAAAQKEKVTP